MCKLCEQSGPSVSRRKLLAGAGAALAAGAVRQSPSFAAETPSAQNAITRDAALERLMQGNAR